MASTAILKVDIIADATKALAAFDKVNGKATSTGSKLGGMGKTMATAFGTAAVIGFGKASFSAAEEAAVAGAKLEQVFSSMGDTTGDAAKAAEDYASALSAKIAVDDEAIMAGQTLLATFSNVSNEAARSAGIFDRATAAGADLAAAGFGSIDANAKMLGKALQDPVKGLTALSKSGVTFTKQQKDQIKAMTEAGDVLGAQKIILGEVEKQVGGTAAASATATGKMSVKFGELQEQIGGKLLPVVNSIVTVFSKYMGLLIPLGATILGVVVAVKAYQAATTAVKVAQEAWNAVQVVFNVIMAANPIMLVVIAIAALVAAVILAYTKVGWFRAGVDKAMKGVVVAFGWVMDAAKAVFNWLRQNWPLLLAIITGPIGLAVLAISRNWDTIKAGASAVYTWVRDKFRALGDAINTALGWISQTSGAVADAIRKPIQAATDVYNWVRDKFNALVNLLNGLVQRIRGAAGNVGNAIKAPINAFIRGWNALRIPEWTIGRVEIFGRGFGPYTLGGWNIPDLPTLARGGSVLRTGMAVVHEGEQFSGVGRRFGTNVTINVNTTGLGADSPDIQRAVMNALRGYASRNGALDLPVRGV
jgi:hypothetical protein